MPEIKLEQLLELVEAIWSACQHLKDEVSSVKEAVEELLGDCLDDGYSSAGSGWGASKAAFSDDDDDMDEEKEASE